MQARLRLTAIAVVTVGLLCLPGVSRAQNDKLEAGFKGSLGLGLVGAELGAVIPALAGVDATWAYIVFPAIGAAGGAVGGYFAIDRDNRAELAVAALTVGMVLVIPTLVVTLSALAYDPGDIDTSSAQARGSPGATAEQAHARAKARRARSAHMQLAAGTGMLRVSEGALSLAAPSVSVIPSMRASGATHVSGLHVSLMSGQF